MAINSAFIKTVASADEKEWDTGSHSNPPRTRPPKYLLDWRSSSVRVRLHLVLLLVIVIVLGGID
jgi:hypothetical protein